MSLPISVLLRQLERYAPAHSGFDPNQRIAAVRDYPDGNQSPREDILYLIPEASQLPAFPAADDFPPSSLCFAVPATLSESALLRGAGCRLLSFPDGTDYGEVCRELRKLFAQQDAWEARLEAESSLPALLEVCGFGEGLTALIWDAGLNLCAAYPPVPAADHSCYEIAGRLRGASLRLCLECALLGQKSEIISVTSGENTGAASAALAPVYWEEEPVLFTALLSEDGPVPELDRYRLCLLARRLADCRAQTEAPGPAAVLTASGPLSARFEGLPPSASPGGDEHFFLFVIEFEDYFPLKARMLLDSLRRYLPDAPVIWLQRQICVLNSTTAARTREIEPRFNTLLTTYQAYCGISKRLSSLTELRTACEQARTALRLGRADHHPQKSESRCYSYGDYAEMHSLAMYARSMGTLLSLLPARLDSFYRDSLRDDSDIRLLSIFLNTGMSPSATARAMSIHRNTVVNRLNRMREEYNIDLGNADCLHDVTRMLSIADYYRRYGTENPLDQE